MNAAAINATLHDSRYQQCLLYTSPPNAAVAKGAREFYKKTQNRIFLPRTGIPWHKNRQGSWQYQDPNKWPKCRCQQVRTKSDNFFKLSLSVTGQIGLGQDASDRAARSQRISWRPYYGFHKFKHGRCHQPTNSFSLSFCLHRKHCRFLFRKHRKHPNFRESRARCLVGGRIPYSSTDAFLRQNNAVVIRLLIYSDSVSAVVTIVEIMPS